MEGYNYNTGKYGINRAQRARDTYNNEREIGFRSRARYHWYRHKRDAYSHDPMPITTLPKTTDRQDKDKNNKKEMKNNGKIDIDNEFSDSKN